MSWKTTLYDYVHSRNQMDIDYSVEPLLPVVKDEAYLKTQAKRLARREETDRLRRLTPVKNETRLTIASVIERNGRMIAEIQLKRNIVGQINYQPHEEQRIERERVTLSPSDAGYIIEAIEPVETEEALRIRAAQPGGLMEADDTFAAVGLMRAPSVPFLNYSVLPQIQYARVSYNRAEAVQYADQWWDKSNPSYINFEVNCSSYVSQCLFAGGAPMNYTGKRNAGWWYKGREKGQELWSFSWAVADSLQFYLLTSRSGLRATEVPEAWQLDIGDVISYDWDGDGRFQHSTIVTAKDANGMPLVNANTVSSKHRYWSYTDSPAYTERTRYRLLHIPDTL
ncbi:amidase domain-containing protein [Paenibacillus cremeus]|uniref:Amidase domain-containing protein n=1 Tax=Paenibacillus cremeus TaxID=2163881 RepID=A0A559KDI1_9BACL|nr:amidase domain-containing protein [Paenibacillus cremeus]TVY10175.1 amidase domain-containing protein [Paenibacillus cremeus]